MKIKMPSKYTVKNELVKGRTMLSINLMKVMGEFINPKGMTNHLKRPSLAFRAVFHTSKGSIGTYQTLLEGKRVPNFHLQYALLCHLGHIYVPSSELAKMIWEAH